MTTKVENLKMMKSQKFENVKIPSKVMYKN